MPNNLHILCFFDVFFEHFFETDDDDDDDGVLISNEEDPDDAYNSNENDALAAQNNLANDDCKYYLFYQLSMCHVASVLIDCANVKAVYCAMADHSRFQYMFIHATL
jgi:hypothetical protein